MNMSIIWLRMWKDNVFISNINIKSCESNKSTRIKCTCHKNFKNRLFLSTNTSYILGNNVFLETDQKFIVMPFICLDSKLISWSNLLCLILCFHIKYVVFTLNLLITLPLATHLTNHWCGLHFIESQY